MKANQKQTIDKYQQALNEFKMTIDSIKLNSRHATQLFSAANDMVNEVKKIVGKNPEEIKEQSLVDFTDAINAATNVLKDSTTDNIQKLATFAESNLSDHQHRTGP